LRLFKDISVFVVRSFILRHPVVFSYQTAWQYSGDYPLSGASNPRGMKNHDFRPISCFISEIMPDRAVVTKEGE